MTRVYAFLGRRPPRELARNKVEWITRGADERWQRSRLVRQLREAEAELGD